MNILPDKQSLLSILMVMPLLFSCDTSEEDEQKETTQNQPATVENTMAANQAAQNQIEQEAISSLAIAAEEGSFSYATKRELTINLNFEKMQFQEQISIYSTLSSQPDPLLNLLEQGTINQSYQYKTVLTVPNTLESFIVVRNDDFSKGISLSINNHSQVNHNFEE